MFLLFLFQIYNIIKHKTMILNYDNEILSVNCGRVKVAYFEAEKKIKLIRTIDNQIITEKPFIFELKAFVKIVGTQNIIFNHK